MRPQEIETLEKHTQALNALAEALKKESVNLPLDKVLWSADTCAAYIGASKEYFAQYVASKPGFPASAKKSVTENGSDSRLLTGPWRIGMIKKDDAAQKNNSI